MSTEAPGHSTSPSAVQGVMYTAQAGPVVQSTGIDDGLAFGWQVRGANLEQMNAAFSTLRLQPRTAFGG